MKKIFAALILLCLLLTSCGAKYPGLPKNAVAFKTGTFSEEREKNSHLTFEYKGRKYVSYSTIEKAISGDEIDECIGYIIQDETNSSLPDKSNTDQRVYTLKDDKKKNYLMVYYIETSMMNQPEFFRADDTRGKDISTPDYISESEYDYWKSGGSNVTEK